jgi:hypothetical protein
MPPPEAAQTLEGRLIGQRKVLAMLVAAMPQDGALWARLEERAQVQDHEEDPGVMPSGAYAIEAAAAEEVRLILEMAARSREAAPRDAD